MRYRFAILGLIAVLGALLRADHYHRHSRPQKGQGKESGHLRPDLRRAGEEPSG